MKDIGFTCGEDSLLMKNIEGHIAIDDSEKSYFKSIVSIKSVAKKELLLRQGALCKRLYFVEEGSIRALHVNEDGKESTVMFAIRDWWITDMHGFVNQKPALVSLEALEDSIVGELEFKSFETLLEKIPSFERYYRILFQNAYVREQQRILDSISLTTEARYTRFVKKYPQMVEKVTQKQIASYLGVTPEFLSTIKKK